MATEIVRGGARYRRYMLAVYQRHDFKGEKRTALDAWGRHIDALVRGQDTTNVVAFPAPA